MGLRSIENSPKDQSENLELLARIERRLCIPDANNFIANEADYNAEDCDPPYTQLSRELWSLILDVVFAPLWLRIRAAELLNMCCNMQESNSNDIVKINTKETHKLRAIVSSTCQAMEELDATNSKQAEQLFTWLEFVERVMLATHSDVCAYVFCRAMYVGMLTKMLRILSACSTQVFAATTVCLGLFHDHEKKCGRSVLVMNVLRDMKEGTEHLSGALLHVINSCGCPCPLERIVHLCNTLQLFGDILADETAADLVFVNDFKILIDLVIRECTDLAQEDIVRLHYLVLLEQVLGSQLYLQTHMYRKYELWGLLESLLDAGAREDSDMPMRVTEKIKQILVKFADLLD
ncbi:Coeffector of mDia Rho GTPase, regulates actin polymerization and cell adhesion turnover [Plasmopara halstedii]|uniref:Coeffector of mDia Rho GTPase, regulates actin polymerization and cell adhesion turnover n=1 Tax=Plasmopara halstedii TaxID=4781 RepID=A0A0P1AXL3_PLAHL|nr:Coeffector of mDia Rho GTPase, regulates actin polymerization and cell adhesion turnover [Plasmopara halstedii]CEG46528.1 Coeffector of mDia Rho GTPase, regulates actin polymerization and cell adhesion turnover [Plasmopara halstedii]|eukprot:XP_024582897.1 Coeffector of mDia Rho GTPase, regulates actin polymerization and cell adhesion turnover [Plasmopara halstedii]